MGELDVRWGLLRAKSNRKMNKGGAHIGTRGIPTQCCLHARPQAILDKFPDRVEIRRRLLVLLTLFHDKPAMFVSVVIAFT